MANPIGNNKAYLITAVIKRVNFNEFTSFNLKEMFIKNKIFKLFILILGIYSLTKENLFSK